MERVQRANLAMYAVSSRGARQSSSFGWMEGGVGGGVGGVWSGRHEGQRLYCVHSAYGLPVSPALGAGLRAPSR